MYNRNWYDKLNKSSLNPPNYVFSIVWPILYILIFISGYKIWSNNKCYPFCFAMVLFIIQMILNLSWSNIFFKNKQIKFAFFVLILIIIFTLLTIKYFYDIDKTAAYLLIPYIIWLCFAAYLNLYIIKYNHIK